MSFGRIAEQTAIISLYNINYLVLITEKECVYCAVRTGPLCIYFRLIYISKVSDIDRNFDIVINHKSNLRFCEEIKQGNTISTFSSHVY